MAILAFQKPDKVIMLESTDSYGRFEFRPLEPGYGQTIGNALRRILLASLEGFAISQIKISGVDQEFATIPGVIEGMQDIILNLKEVRFRRMVDSWLSRQPSHCRDTGLGQRSANPCDTIQGSLCDGA